MTENYLEYQPAFGSDTCVGCNGRLYEGARVHDAGIDTSGHPVYRHVQCVEQDAAEPTHEGRDPGHGGSTLHRGDRAACPAPDCLDAEAACCICGGDPCSTCGECPGQICRDCRCDQRERDDQEDDDDD